MCYFTKSLFGFGYDKWKCTEYSTPVYYVQYMYCRYIFLVVYSILKWLYSRLVRNVQYK